MRRFSLFKKKKDDDDVLSSSANQEKKGLWGWMRPKPALRVTDIELQLPSSYTSEQDEDAQVSNTAEQDEDEDAQVLEAEAHRTSSKIVGTRPADQILATNKVLNSYGFITHPGKALHWSMRHKLTNLRNQVPLLKAESDSLTAVKEKVALNFAGHWGSYVLFSALSTTLYHDRFNLFIWTQLLILLFTSIYFGMAYYECHLVAKRIKGRFNKLLNEVKEDRNDCMTVDNDDATADLNLTVGLDEIVLEEVVPLIGDVNGIRGHKVMFCCACSVGLVIAIFVALLCQLLGLSAAPSLVVTTPTTATPPP